MSPNTEKKAMLSAGFSLIEVIVAVTIMAVLSAAIVPVMFNKIDQARYERTYEDLQAIYEATMGKQEEGYFGYVGDMGKLPDSVGALIDGAETDWNGPYLAMSGSTRFTDVYGNSYVVDDSLIRIRSFGPDGTDNGGAGDDMSYPENPLTSFDGRLVVQVYINGRLIPNAATEQVSASISYSNEGTPADMSMLFDTDEMRFGPTSVHQGKHVLTVTASLGPTDTEAKQVVTILPGTTQSVDVFMADSAYFTRMDTDLNNNGIADRYEDYDGDGWPNSMDADIDGDGSPNEIDPDDYDPTVTGGGTSSTVQVTSVTPSFGNQGDNNLLLTIDGLYFDEGASVTFSGTGISILSTNYVSSSQLTVTVDISGSANTGLRNVTVENSTGASGVGENLFEVLASGASPAPIISQLVPDNADQGETAITVTIQGQNFQTGPTVTIDNGNITINSTSYINTSQVNINITVDPAAATGASTLRLTNSDGKFDEATFTVNPITPNISSINPNNADYGDRLWITVSGTNFLSGFTASGSNGLSILSTSYQTTSSVRVRVECPFTLTDRSCVLTITNPGGGSDQANFTVNGLF